MCLSHRLVLADDTLPEDVRGLASLISQKHSVASGPPRLPAKLEGEAAPRQLPNVFADRGQAGIVAARLIADHLCGLVFSRVFTLVAMTPRPQRTPEPHWWNRPSASTTRP